MSVSCVEYFNWNTQLLSNDTLLDLTAKSKKAVSWRNYLTYNFLYYLFLPAFVTSRVILFAKNFFSRKNTHYAEVQDHIKSYFVDKTKHHSLENLVELTQKMNKHMDPHMREFIIDVFAMEKNLSHISEILKGANIEIVGDDGEFFHRWKALGATSRTSSHRCDEDLSYSLNDNVFHELLFWKDSTLHNTRFQFESSPLKGSVFSSILHMHDYLNYKRRGLQQGQFGQSSFTEDDPIKIVFNKETFERNRKELASLFSGK